jgi:hypothetical protein
MAEYQLSYTASEIDERLGLVVENKENINIVNKSISAINESIESINTELENKADVNHTHEYAELGHVHSEYAEANHTHDNYAEKEHNHDELYDATGTAEAMLTESKSYTDDAVKAVKNDLLNGAGEQYDTLKELGDLIDENVDAIEALELVATSKANKDHTHEIANVNGLKNELDGKAASDHTHPTDTTRAAASDLTSHTSDTTVHVTSEERTNWNDANSKKHAHNNKTVLDNTTASYTTEEKNKLAGIASEKFAASEPNEQATGDYWMMSY